MTHWMAFLVGVLLSTSLTSSESLSMDIRLQDNASNEGEHTKAKMLTLLGLGSACLD